MRQTKKPARIVLCVPYGIKVELYSIFPIAHLSIFTSLLTPPINEMLSYTLDADPDEDFEQSEKISNPGNRQRYVRYNFDIGGRARK
jgi:hypothetical protein